MGGFTKKHFEQLTNPQSIVIVGASTATGPGSYNLMENLINEGFDKTMYPVNLTADEVLGHKAYPRVLDIPEPTDLAIVMVPRTAVRGALADCVEKGIKTVLVISQGFADADPAGCELQDQLIELVKDTDTRIIGPNTIGIANSFEYFHTSFQKFDLYNKRNALLCQSGMFVLASGHFTSGLGIGVDIGNGAEVDFTDLLPHLAADRRIDVINLHMEGLADGAEFVRIASEITPTKPIIAFKVGQSEEGARAAASHSGALSSEEHVVNAVFEKAGVMRVKNLEEMSDLNKALLTYPGINGKRIAVISISGGGGITVVDALSEHGLDIATPSQDVLAKIQIHNPPWLEVGNPVDTWMAVLKRGLARANVEILNLLLQDDKVDGAIVLLNAYRSTGYESLRELIDGIVETQKQFTDKPIALWAFGMNRHEVIEKAEESGVVAAFTNPASAARALAGLHRYHHDIKGRTREPLDDLAGIEAERAAEILATAAGQNVEVLGAETLAVLEAYGIKTALTRLARDRDELVQTANEIGYPLVMKIASKQIVHKSDIGGVKLNIRDEEELLKSFGEMYSNIKSNVADAVIDGVHLQRQHGEGVEMLIGASRHEACGPVIVFGLGGIYTEILNDVSFALAPVSRLEAQEMIGKLRSKAILAGARGSDAVDTDLVIDAIVRVSRLLEDFPQIRELDINPFTVNASNGVALDARAILTVG
jgi:acyl-CoA synthetase (NDP forming)